MHEFTPYNSTVAVAAVFLQGFARTSTVIATDRYVVQKVYVAFMLHTNQSSCRYRLSPSLTSSLKTSHISSGIEQVDEVLWPLACPSQGRLNMHPAPDCLRPSRWGIG